MPSQKYLVYHKIGFWRFWVCTVCDSFIPLIYFSLKPQFQCYKEHSSLCIVFLLPSLFEHVLLWRSSVSDLVIMWQIFISCHLIRSPKISDIFTLFIHQKLHILSSLQSRDSRPLLLVLTLLFTFQFNHLQHHDSSVVYILNAYDLSVL